MPPTFPYSTVSVLHNHLHCRDLQRVLKDVMDAYKVFYVRSAGRELDAAQIASRHLPGTYAIFMFAGLDSFYAPCEWESGGAAEDAGSPGLRRPPPGSPREPCFLPVADCRFFEESPGRYAVPRGSPVLRSRLELD